MAKKIEVQTSLMVKVELVDEMKEIMKSDGWEYTGSHEPYEVDGTLQQVLHFKSYTEWNNLY